LLQFTFGAESEKKKGVVLQRQIALKVSHSNHRTKIAKNSGEKVNNESSKSSLMMRAKSNENSNEKCNKSAEKTVTK